MGSVALLAGSYLLQNLRAIPVFELDSEEFFEIDSVDIKDGIATMGRLPRSLFFEWRDPRGKHDLLIFVGESQPETGGYALCQQILDYAEARGVKRIFTFAAMATQLHPGNTPRTFAVATSQAALNEVKGTNVEVLSDGQITGLNGVLLGAGTARKITGVCLLGELPYFAVSVPNPGAALAVLEHFSQLLDLKIDLTDLKQQATIVEKQLQQLMERLQAAAEDAASDEALTELEPGEEEEPPAPAAAASKPAPPAPEPQLDQRQKRRIEQLFQQALQDRSKAFDLKRELDRLGVFKQYEDRFLDLFRHAQ